MALPNVFDARVIEAKTEIEINGGAGAPFVFAIASFYALSRDDAMVNATGAAPFVEPEWSGSADGTGLATTRIGYNARRCTRAEHEKTQANYNGLTAHVPNTRKRKQTTTT